MKILATRLTYLNSHLLYSPVSNYPKKMEVEDLNKILLHAAPNGWTKQAHTPVWDF